MEERPKPQQRDGWPAWLQFVLGVAGIVVTVAGIIALSASKAPAPIAVQPRSTPVAIEVAAPLTREPMPAERPSRDEAGPKPDAVKCLGGVLLHRYGNEWRNVGHC